MIALLQRVSRADVVIDGQTVGEIGRGLMVLVCAVRGDTEEKAKALASRVARYRVFEDEAGKMNKSVSDIGGSLLVVSQFTLAADTRSGNRPSFTPAAPPEEGKHIYDVFVQACRETGLIVEIGRFGAHMAVSLTNDGPVTITLSN